MGVDPSKDRAGILLVLIGAVLATIWNLGTKIDISDLTTTILNPLFVAGAVLVISGIWVMMSNR
jgi:hypothetical protein